MSNEAVITVSNDPLRSVADALDAAVQAGKGGSGGHEGDRVRRITGD